MEKMFNLCSVICGFIGGVLTFLFGEFDALLYTLLAFAVIDYITGVIKGICTKTLSSKIGIKGFFKKLLIFIVVAVAYLLQKIIDVPLREFTIMFFICNECISILENAGEFIPLPNKIKEVLLQLRNNLDMDETNNKEIK